MYATVAQQAERLSCKQLMPVRFRPVAFNYPVAQPDEHRFTKPADVGSSPTGVIDLARRAVAQRRRVAGFEPAGCGFESRRPC